MWRHWSAAICYEKALLSPQSLRTDFQFSSLTVPAENLRVKKSLSLYLRSVTWCLTWWSFPSCGSWGRPRWWRSSCTGSWSCGTWTRSGAPTRNPGPVCSAGTRPTWRTSFVSVDSGLLENGNWLAVTVLLLLSNSLVIQIPWIQTIQEINKVISTSFSHCLLNGLRI